MGIGFVNLIGALVVSIVPLFLNVLLRFMSIGGVMLIFAMFGLIGIWVVYFLPETLGVPLQDLVVEMRGT